MVDELPILAVTAVGAEGTSMICGAEELRAKESDRVHATVAMLRAFCVKAEERPDGMVVHGRPGVFCPAAVDSFGDHRIAMSAAVATVARTQGETTIAGWESVATSYDNFAGHLREISGAATTLNG